MHWLQHVEVNGSGRADPIAPWETAYDAYFLWDASDAPVDDPRGDVSIRPRELVRYGQHAEAYVPELDGDLWSMDVRQFADNGAMVVTLGIDADAHNALALYHPTEGFDVIARAGETTDQGIQVAALDFNNLQLNARGDILFELIEQQSNRRYVMLYRPDERLAGDFNGNGAVDGADFLAWQVGVGLDERTAVLADGDANGDGNADAAVLFIWSEQFGAGRESRVQAIPEPSGAAILCVFIAVAFASRAFTCSKAAGSACRRLRGRTDPLVDRDGD